MIIEKEVDTMTFDEYQELSKETAIYPNVGSNFDYPTFGLCGEAGEVAEKVKKIHRDRGGEVDDECKAAVAKELGDVLYYVAAVAWEFGLSMDYVAKNNVEKLHSRMERGKLRGDGDNR